MKNLSTGTGLALLAGAALAYPFVSSLAPSANASAVTAVSTAVTTQAGPTIVWYGTASLFPDNGLMGVVRAWSDGKVELKLVNPQTSGNHYCTPLPINVPCAGPWFVISDPAQGLTFDADLNFDQSVDGADLGMLLAKWGPAPRNPVPPSDCPLALVNP